MNTFSLKIFAADKVFYQGTCQSLVVPTVDGQYGIQAGHENTIIAVNIGIAAFTDGDGKRQRAVLSDGICMVERGEVVIMVETAERPDEIDRVAAEREAAEAKEAIRGRDNMSDVKRAKAKMARAASRLSAKGDNEID